MFPLREPVITRSVSFPVIFLNFARRKHSGENISWEFRSNDHHSRVLKSDIVTSNSQQLTKNELRQAKHKNEPPIGNLFKFQKNVQMNEMI